MKILKIFGLVAGIHLFALILIFANPGCSATSKQPPTPADTIAQGEAPASLSVPMTAPSATTAAPTPVNDTPMFTPAPTIDPNAAAVSAGSSAAIGLRVTPTRPNTPVATAIVAEPVGDVTPATTYTVVSGDNLWNLAKKHHLTVAELAAANGLKTSTVLHPGQKLVIPKQANTSGPASSSSAPAGKSAGAGVPPAKVATGESIKHVVQPGETLSGIAKRYEVRYGDIVTANHITDPRSIRPGMELTIPGWQSTGAKSGKAGSKQSVVPSSTAPATAPAVEPEAVKPPMLDVPVNRVEDSPFTPAPKK